MAMARTGRAHATRRKCRGVVNLVAVLAALGMTTCGGAAPTAPGGVAMGASDVLAIELFCPATLLIGQRGPCAAFARLRSGQAPVVSFDATWSSTGPEVVTLERNGIVRGRSAGQAAVSASYGGRQGVASVVVTAEDA